VVFQGFKVNRPVFNPVPSLPLLPYSGIVGMAKASGDPGHNKVVGANHFIGGNE